MVIPVRHRLAGIREYHHFTLEDEHPLLDRRYTCPACDAFFNAGESITLVYVGPGPDPEIRKKAAGGGWHTGFAVAVHAGCGPVRRKVSDG